MWTGTWWVLNFTHLYCFPWISSTYTWHLCPWLSLSLKSVNDHLFDFKALRGKCHSHQRRTEKHQPYRNSETKLAQLYDTSELWAHFILNIFKGKQLLIDAETRKRVVLHWRAKSDADEAFKVSQRWGMGGRQIMWSDTIHTCVCDIYLFISQIEPSANTRDEIRQFLDLIHENRNLFQISDTLLADLLFGIFSADCGSVISQQKSSDVVLYLYHCDAVGSPPAFPNSDPPTLSLLLKPWLTMLSFYKKHSWTWEVFGLFSHLW